MTAETQIIQIQPSQPLQGWGPLQAAQAVEVAKMLKLVAPASMAADAQTTWLAAAVDALEDINPAEIAAVSAEVRRLVTRPQQIVPEIANLVGEKRKRAANRVDPDAPATRDWAIHTEAQKRRSLAKNQDEIEAAWQWERDQRIAAGLHVQPIAKPLTSREIAGLSPAMVRMGLKCGALAERDGKLVNGTA